MKMFFFTAQVLNELQQLQVTVKELRAENTELKRILESKDKKIVILEGHIKGFDQKHNQALKDRDAKAAAQTRELEIKSDTIAYLTSQLHHAKLNRSGKDIEESVQPRRKEGEESSIDEDSYDVPRPSPVTPMPPREGMPSGIRRPYRRVSSSPIPQDVSSLAKPKSSRAIGIQAYPNEIQLNCKPAKSSKGMPSRPMRGTSPARPRHGISKTVQRSAETGREKIPPEDYLEFLKTGSRADPQIVVRPVPEPLPPISANERLAATPYTGRVQVSRGHSSQGVPAAIYSMGPEGEAASMVTDDVGKIVVSPLSSPEKGWRHKQQSHQQNGPE